MDTYYNETMVKELHIFRASVDTSGIRQDVYLGRDQLVVPVIALVEGVLHPSNAKEPELALASEFGKVPVAWDGSPVVMNHPKVDGNQVSANSPGILEAIGFGVLFNTTLDDKKLKTEAWIDLERVNELGGEVAETIERVQSGEIVEVSTGLFAVTIPQNGKHDGKKFSGVWREIIPDHLAFLSEGATGACSVDDGCGTRNNMKAAAKACECENKERCTCNLGKPEERLQRLISNAFPDSMMNRDVQSLLFQAIQTKFGEFAWLIMYDQNRAIFELFDSDTFTSKIHQIDFDISDNTKVEFSGEAERVNIMTRVVPVQLSAKGNTMSDKTEAEIKAEAEAKVKANEEAAAKKKADDEATVKANAEAEAVKAKAEADAKAEAEAKAKENANKPLQTAEEYIAGAPAGIREVLSEGLRANVEEGNRLITAIKATDRCDFTEAELKDMNLSQLKKLARLSNVPDFSGQAPSGHSTVTNTDDDDRAPAPPLAFPPPKLATAE